MEDKLRNSGIGIVGNAPWGTHFCQFYKTKEDLIDVLVPYFKAGLENNEFCMWITSEPLSAEEAKEALKKAVPDIDDYIDKGQIEILPYTEWYVMDGDFNSDRILDGWVSKLNQALKKGYEGLRLTGNTFWLEKDGWNDFVEYEEAVDNIIGKYQMMALCTYCLDKCTAAEIIDVVNNHEFALTKRDGKWDLIENSEHKQTKEDAIQAKRDWEQTFDAVPDLIAILDHKHRVIRANKAMAEKLGVTLEECIGLPCYYAVHGTSESPSFCPHSQLIADGREHTTEVHEEALGGDFIVSASPLYDSVGELMGSVHVARDITGRKKAEEQIRDLLEETQLFAEELEVSNEELQNTTEELQVANEELRQQSEDMSRINRALEKSEKRMQRSQEIAHIGSWELDVPNNRLFWSDEVYRIFGLKPQEFKATYGAFLDAVHPDDRLTVDEAYSGSLREGKDNYEIEHRILRESGEVRFVHEKCEHIRDESGRVIRSVGMVHDITERKQAEEALIWNQQRNELLINVTSRLITSEDPQVIIDDLCQETMKFLGCDVFFNYLVDDEKGCLHLNAYGGIPKEDADEIEWLDYGVAVCGCAALEARRIIAEDIFETPDEGTDLVESYGVQAYACHPLMIENKCIGTLSFGTKSRITFTDKEIEVMKAVSDQISIAMNRLLSNRALKEAHDNLEEQVEERTAELEEAYESLKLSYAYNRSLIEASVDPLVTIGRDGKITDVNASTEIVTGFNRDDLIGTDFSNYFTEPEKAREGYKQVFREGEVRDYELEIRHKSGHLTPVLYNASAYKDESEEVIGIFAAARDITGIKIAEDKLKIIIDELKRSNKELQSFAFITSHDLQEPLRTMGSFAGLLKRRYEGKLGSDADEFIDYMVNGALRMQDMIRGLLEYSRVGTRGDEFKEFSTEKALNNALYNLKSSIEECNGKVTNDPLPVIFADEMQIIGVFQNLIGNSLKFCRDGVPPKIHISAKKEGNEYVFSVQDNGIGIEEQYTDRIFEVFKRLHAIGEYEGAGIGLAIVKRIMERHGGYIWVESSFGVGSTFNFTIPMEGNNYF